MLAQRKAFQVPPRWAAVTLLLVIAVADVAATTSTGTKTKTEDVTASRTIRSLTASFSPFRASRSFRNSGTATWSHHSGSMAASTSPSESRARRNSWSYSSSSTTSTSRAETLSDSSSKTIRSPSVPFSSSRSARWNLHSPSPSKSVGTVSSISWSLTSSIVIVETPSNSVSTSTAVTLTRTVTRSVRSRTRPTYTTTRTSSVEVTSTFSVKQGIHPHLSVSAPTLTITSTDSRSRRSSTFSPTNTTDPPTSTYSVSVTPSRLTPKLTPSRSWNATPTDSRTPTRSRSRMTHERSLSRSGSATELRRTLSITESFSRAVPTQSPTASFSKVPHSRSVSTSPSSSLTWTRPLPPSRTKSKTPQRSGSTSGSPSTDSSRSPSKPTKTSTIRVSDSRASVSASLSPSRETVARSHSTSISIFRSRSAISGSVTLGSRTSTPSSTASGSIGSATLAASASLSDTVSFSVPLSRTSTHSMSWLTASMDITASKSQPSATRSTSAPYSTTFSRATSRQPHGGMSLTLSPQFSSDVSLSGPSSSASSSGSSEPTTSPTMSPSLSHGTVTRSPTYTSSPSRTPSLSSSTSGSVSPTNVEASTTRNRRPSHTSLVTHSRRSPTTSTTLSRDFGTASLSERVSLTFKRNISKSRSGSRPTVTVTVSVTASRRKTLTMTQTIVIHRRVANSLSDYFRYAFDFSSVHTPVGVCAAIVPTIASFFLLVAAIGIVRMLYLRVKRRRRPLRERENDMSTRRAWQVWLRGHLYLGAIFPCHFHCFWIHVWTLTVHLSGVCLLVALMLLPFESPSHTGLLSGTSGLGVVVGLIAAGIPHIFRPALNFGFHYVTYDVRGKWKCQNDEGMTWQAWHERRAGYLAEEARRVEGDKRAREEEERVGIPQVKAALLDELDWEGAVPAARDESAVSVADGGTGGDGNGDGAVQTKEANVAPSSSAVATPRDISKDSDAQAEQAASKGSTDCEGYTSVAPLHQQQAASVADAAFRDEAVLQQFVLDIDISIGSDDEGDNGDNQNTLAGHGAHLPNVRWHVDPELLMNEALRTERLEKRWGNPLSQLWWGPVETHHMLVAAVWFLVAVGFLSGYESAVQRFDSEACTSSGSLSTGLVVAVVMDVVLFETIHQLCLIAWRYLSEHEGQVDYTSSLSRRLVKLIIVGAEHHPYQGEYRVWPEEELRSD